MSACERRCGTVSPATEGRGQQPQLLLTCYTYLVSASPRPLPEPGYLDYSCTSSSTPASSSAGVKSLFHSSETQLFASQTNHHDCRTSPSSSFARQTRGTVPKVPASDPARSPSTLGLLRQVSSAVSSCGSRELDPERTLDHRRRETSRCNRVPPSRACTPLAGLT